MRLRRSPLIFKGTTATLLRCIFFYGGHPPRYAHTSTKNCGQKYQCGVCRSAYKRQQYKNSFSIPISIFFISYTSLKISNRFDTYGCCHPCCVISCWSRHKKWELLPIFAWVIHFFHILPIFLKFPLGSRLRQSTYHYMITKLNSFALVAKI